MSVIGIFTFKQKRFAVDLQFEYKNQRNIYYKKLIVSFNIISHLLIL